MSMANNGISPTGSGLGRIPLEGNLSLRDARRVCDKLREALEAFDSVEIDIASLAGMDIGIAQILLAARKSAVRWGKVFGLAGEPAEPVRAFLAGVGLIEHKDADEAFWLGRGNAERAI